MTPAALAQLHAAAFHTGRPWSADEFAALLQDPHTHIVTHPGGFALWRAIADEAELLTIAVDPVHQRQGIGRALLHALAATANTQAATLILEVAADNAAALALYLGAGFQTVGRRQGYYRRGDGPAADALILRASLPLGHSGESPGPPSKNG